MRNESTKAVLELIRKDKQIIAATADNGNEIYEVIKKEFPLQHVDYGISECNMVASAAGLASRGKIPFLYAVTNFMSMRAFEFIRNVVCVPRYNVKFLGRSAGVTSGSMGMTHQGTEDLAILRTLPHLLVITPASPLEAKLATYAAYEYDGPVYIRLEGVREPEIFPQSYEFKIGKGNIIKDGNEFCIISTGSIINEAIQAAKVLEEECGLRTRVLNCPIIKPIDEELILQTAQIVRGIVTIEENTIWGGLGSAVAEILAENNCNVKFKRIGLKNFAHGCGNREEMREINGLKSANIVDMVKILLR